MSQLQSQLINLNSEMRVNQLALTQAIDNLQPTHAAAALARVLSNGIQTADVLRQINPTAYETVEDEVTLVLQRVGFEPFKHDKGAAPAANTEGGKVNTAPPTNRK